MDILNQIGEWQQVYTLVDFYTYIKGVEYLICLLFFITFPMFYRYLHGPRNEQH
jgi:hypothetical protein